MLGAATSIVVDPCVPALSACLDPVTVLDSLRTGMSRISEVRRQSWCEARLLEALYHPGRYVRVVYAMLSNSETPIERAWPEEELVSLFAPVRRPMSGRGEILSIDGQEVEAYGFPNDRRLRGLRTFARRDLTLSTIREWTPGETIEEDSLQRKLIRYVPEQKCVMRVRAQFRESADSASTRRIGVRCSMPEDCAELKRRHDILQSQLGDDSLLVIPRVVGFDADRGLLGVEWLRGRFLTESPDQDERCIRLAARAIGQFHGLRISGLPEVTNGDLLGNIRDCVNDLLATVPDVRDEIAQLGTELTALLESTVPGAPVTIHHDLHPGQFLFKHSRVSILDLERMAVGSADIDIANFATQLDLLGFRPDRSVKPSSAAFFRRHFLSSWIDECGGALDARRFHLLCARSRLELARGMVRHLRPWSVPFASVCVQCALEDLRRAVDREEIL